MHRLKSSSRKETMQFLNGVVRLSQSQITPFSRFFSTGSSRTNLFIAGLSYDTNETILKDAFGKHGEITEAVRVICDHVSGKSRGYGFVWFASEAAASSALQEMNGQLIDGRSICVQYAHKG